MKTIVKAIATLGFVIAGLVNCEAQETNVNKRVFELRTYTATPGKMDELVARFRDHTVKLLEKHHMTVIGFWKPTDEQLSKQQLIYLLAFPSLEAAKKSWDEFNDDPEWPALRSATEKNGGFVEDIESIYLAPTDFSELK
jgi:hypothetical protein